MSQFHRLIACLRVASWLMMGLLIAGGAQAAEPVPTPLLADRPWQELSHGVSLHPPIGAKLQAFTGDDAVVRIQEPSRYLISVYLRKRQAPVAAVPNKAGDKANPSQTKPDQAPLTLDVVAETALRQIATAQPNAKIRPFKSFQINASSLPGQAPQSIPGHILYFDIPDTKPWVLGQALAVVDSQTVLLVEMQSPLGQIEQTQPLFEAVLKSLRIQNPAVLIQQREAMIERGQAWFKTLEPAQFHKILIPEQWMRIVADQADVGYLRIRQSTEKVLGKTGVRVELLSHIQADQQAFDSLKNFFQADDRSYEDWSIKVQIRSLKPKPNNTPSLRPDTFSLTETGVRAQDVITVRRQEATDIDVKESVWQRPGKGYLANVEQHLFHRLLPRTGPVELGFYSYYDNRGKLTFRTDRSVIAPDGTLIVYTRPSPELPETTWRYDSQNRLIECDLGEGRRMIPTSKAQIAAIWKRQIQ